MRLPGLLSPRDGKRIAMYFRAIPIMLSVVVAVVFATPALADAPGISHIEIRSAGSPARAQLTFDEPLTERDAETIRNAVATATANLGSPETLGCNQYTDRQDSNGLLTLQLTCLPSRASLAWGFRLAPELQAIAIGPVSENGLRWWRNSSEQSKNAPHVVPPDYLFHGTMRPAYVNDVLDYQDVLTFRHNVGSGGTARVVFAGSLQLTY